MSIYVASIPPFTHYSHMVHTGFGDWLKHERTIRRLKQADVEKAAGLTRGHVSKLETGFLRVPAEATRARIHAVLGTSDDDLVTAGVLERFGSTDDPVYVVAQPDVALAPPSGALTRADLVLQVLTPLVEEIYWTPQMLEVIKSQLRMMRDVQRGAVEEPRASWEDEE